MNSAQPAFGVNLSVHPMLGSREVAARHSHWMRDQRPMLQAVRPVQRLTLTTLLISRF
jgi:hypothetical protein